MNIFRRFTKIDNDIVNKFKIYNWEIYPSNIYDYSKITLIHSIFLKL